MSFDALRILFCELFPKRKILLLLFLLSLVLGILDLALPFLAEHSLDRIFPSKSLERLCSFARLVGGFYGIQWGIGLLASFLNSRCSLEGSKNIRIRAHQLTLRHYSELDEKTAIETALRIESDALSLVHFVLRGLDIAGKNATAFLGGIFLLGHQDFGLLILFCFYFAVQWGVSQYFLRFFFKRSVENRKINASVFEMLRDHLSKRRVIYLLNIHGFLEKQFRKVQEWRFSVESDSAKWKRMESFLGTGISFVFKMGVGFYLAKSLIRGRLTPGQGAFLLILLPKLQSYFLQLSGLFRDAKMLHDGAGRLLEILEEKEKQGTQNILEFQFLEFRKVCFSREGKTVLNDLSFKITSGEKTVFYGPSGSGKTTVWLLILGLLRPDSGEILLNGEKLESLNLKSWHALLSIVPQENELFRLSLDENVRLGRDSEFFRKSLPDFFSFKEKRAGDSEIYHGELATFSTGELRQVLVARGLWNNAPVLLLDEPDAHWDEVLAERVRAHLFGFPEKTLLVFTHRSSWIQKAEKRISLVQGGTDETDRDNEISKAALISGE